KYPLKDLMLYVNDRLKDQFAMVPGVGDITLAGYVSPSLRVWVDGKKLRDYQISVEDVINTIQNQHSEQPAGKINDREGSHMFFVRTMGEAHSVEQFRNIAIGERGGRINYRRLHLSDVARIEDGLADQLRYSRANGVPGVGLGILKQRGSNA
ncbi:efflux RND transporter permease subunit, partial [Klebsiella pneumoniae]|uniref:efflux RND transporter permease subunit n=1 Tax=Klebsiella pneumoniae TaxID=573 RepID=UPI00273919BF